jgi:hypothetical protein
MPIIKCAIKPAEIVPVAYNEIDNAEVLPENEIMK